jgi:hypothetical protein
MLFRALPPAPPTPKMVIFGFMSSGCGISILIGIEFLGFLEDLTGTV